MSNRISNIAAATASAMFLFPTSAIAEVCDKVEPRWDGGSGPATVVDEIFWALTSLPGIFLLAVMAAVLLSRSRTVGAILGIGLVGLGALLYVADNGGEFRALSIAEGCRTGFPTVEILFAVTGLSVLLFSYLRRVQ